jgi:hypothetical protein
MEYTEQIARIALSGAVSKFGELRPVRSEKPYKWGVSDHYELFTGHRQGVELVDKSQFATIMDAIGYLAPRTAVIRPDDNYDDALERISGINPNQENRFLKPLCGTRAKGTMEAENSEEALAFAREENRPYLVQTVEHVDREWRYALHRDPRQVRNSQPHGWRLAIHKKRSSVVGDGETPLGHLIKSSESIPWYARAKHHLHRGRDMQRVPAAGEYVELAAGGNIDAMLPDENELQIMDRFMKQMTTDLEAYVSTPLPTICFDVGIRNADSLKGSYDHERLRQELVFYEYQVPFGFISYLPALAEQQRNQNNARQIINSILRPATMLTFMNSMFISGKVSRTMRNV